MTELRTTRITEGTPLSEFAESLYNETFDRRMRVPYKELFKAIGAGKAEFTAVYDEDLFIGFYYLFRYNDIDYIYYLAVTESMRNRGYGTEILDHIKDNSTARSVVACVEAPLIDDKLVSSRYRRLGFYSRNGFIDTLYKFTSVGITYEVLYWGSNFEPEMIQDILRSFRRTCGFRR